MKTVKIKLLLGILTIGCIEKMSSQVVISGPLQITSGAPAANKVLTSDAAGNATWQLPSGGGGGGGGWSLLGNSGTTDGVNFIGTTDNIPLTFSVNSMKAGRIDHVRRNTLFGYETGNAITGTAGGQFNTAFGFQCMQFSTMADYNIAIGYRTMQFIGAISHNIAIGNDALSNTSQSTGNVAIGSRVLQSVSGDYNVAVGYEAAMTSTPRDENVALGYRSLFSSSGFFNTAIGSQALNNSSGSGLSAFGAYADANVGSNGTSLGYLAVCNSNDKVRLGNSMVTVIEGAPAFYTSSDGRFKSNLNENEVVGIEFIKLLRPVVYNLETRKFQEFLTKNIPDSIKSKYFNQDFTKSTSIRRSGFIAQEVEEATKKVGYNFDGLHVPVDENDNYSLAYGQFVVPLVKAVQEQQKMIEELQKKLEGTSIRQISSSTSGDFENIIAGFSMSQNEPNPFTHETIINFELPNTIKNSFMVVYDLTGKQITTFDLQINAKSIKITSEDLAAGIYLYSIVGDGKVMGTKRMIVGEK